MSRVLILVSVAVCTIALLFSLDIFAPVPEAVSWFVSNLPPVVSLFTHDRLFTKTELKKYTGDKGGAVYLAILGEVYDVTRGKKHYGPGGGYSFFSGRDGSKAFVTGDFSEKDLTDDITDFNTAEVSSLEEWKEFYKKDYTFVGKVIGNFFDSEGKPTEALVKYQTTLKKALSEKKAQHDLNQIFPPCNSQWSQGGQTRVWCTNRSGGVQRDWVGVPRQYFQPGKTQDKPVCVCVRNFGPPSGGRETESHKNRGDLDNPNLKLYDGCDISADACVYTRNS